MAATDPSAGEREDTGLIVPAVASCSDHGSDPEVLAVRCHVEMLIELHVRVLHGCGCTGCALTQCFCSLPIRHMAQSAAPFLVCSRHINLAGMGPHCGRRWGGRICIGILTGQGVFSFDVPVTMLSRACIITA